MGEFFKAVIGWSLVDGAEWCRLWSVLRSMRVGSGWLVVVGSLNLQVEFFVGCVLLCLGGVGFVYTRGLR